MRIKNILLTLVAFMAISMNAAERFVTYTEQSGALSLAGATIGYSDQEPKAVQIAAANLQQDIASVMGFTPTKSNTPTILIGTVGCNKQIDQWVKQKVLKDLKGKREKFVITTIDGQLVIAYCLWHLRTQPADGRVALVLVDGRARHEARLCRHLARSVY